MSGVFPNRRREREGEKNEIGKKVSSGRSRHWHHSVFVDRWDRHFMGQGGCEAWKTHLRQRLHRQLQDLYSQDRNSRESRPWFFVRRGRWRRGRRRKRLRHRSVTEGLRGPDHRRTGQRPFREHLRGGPVRRQQPGHHLLR